MDKLGKVIAFHPVKSGLKLFYEVIEPDGETRWGGERGRYRGQDSLVPRLLYQHRRG